MSLHNLPLMQNSELTNRPAPVEHANIRVQLPPEVTGQVSSFTSYGASSTDRKSAINIILRSHPHSIADAPGKPAIIICTFPYNLSIPILKSRTNAIECKVPTVTLTPSRHLCY